MTGLEVLYATQAAKAREWNTIPDRQKTGWMRELYWARCAESAIGPKSFVRLGMSFKFARSDVGRTRDEPGDGFFYTVEMMPGAERRFEWFEVTEVFATVPPARIEGAMRALHGLPDTRPIDFEEFRRDLRLGRPSRTEQRRAADLVVDQIGKKLGKRSYRQLFEQYGYGTLVVGLPLWFAAFPDDPMRAENALDDFATRTFLGLEAVRQKVLKRRDCPFKNIVVIWDTTPQAMREWREARSEVYRDAANRTMEGAIGASIWGALPPDSLDRAQSSILHVCVKTRKKASGKGPYPEAVEALEENLRKRRRMGRLQEALKWRAVVSLCKLFCFMRIRGVAGLEQWIARKFSVSHPRNVAMARRKARRYYRESRRRGRFSDTGSDSCRS